jgi:hypothetical protein
MPSVSSPLADRAHRRRPSQSPRLLRVIGTVVLLYFAGTTTQSANTSTPEAPSGLYGHLPLTFEANHGQTDSQVQFLARAAGYQLFLTRGDAVLAFRAPATQSRASEGVPTKTQKAQPTGDMKQAVVRMALEGANPDPHVMGLEQLPGKVNYSRGNVPDEWQTMYPRTRKSDTKPCIPASTSSTTVTRVSWNTTSSSRPEETPTRSPSVSRALTVWTWMPRDTSP